MKWKLTGLLIFFSNLSIASSTPHNLTGYNNFNTLKYRPRADKWYMPVIFSVNKQPVLEFTTWHKQSCPSNQFTFIQPITAKNIYTETMNFADGSPAANQPGDSTELKKLKDFWKTNELLIGLSFVILVGLIIFFVWRKKKSKNVDLLL